MWVQRGQDMVRSSVSPALPVIPWGNWMISLLLLLLCPSVKLGIKALS